MVTVIKISYFIFNRIKNSKGLQEQEDEKKDDNFNFIHVTLRTLCGLMPQMFQNIKYSNRFNRLTVLLALSLYKIHIN